MSHLPSPNAELALPDLEQAVAAVLSDVPAPADERVAAVPDARTLRWYQSIGVIDRPLRYQGRTAIYGRRHVLQAVCVKLLQARGHSVAQAQAALAGATDAVLEAAVAEAVGVDAPAPTPIQAPAPRRLITAELAPGVLVTVDPALVADPDALLRALSTVITPGVPR